MLEILETFKRAFLLKLLLELDYSGSFKCYKMFSIKMKKGSPKRCKSDNKPPKKIKILHMTRDTRKTSKRGKIKKYKKSLTM